MSILDIQHLKKSFSRAMVLDDLSFTLHSHEIYGFLGVNGSGKTTTMKCILGLYPVDGGQILVNGEPVCFGETKTNRWVGYLPDVPEFYGFLSAYEYLELCSRISSYSINDQKSRILSLLDQVGLRAGEKHIKTFSRGMKQRLGIAQALIHNPKLLICDEPTSALDPVGRKEILNVLHAVKAETAILFSTHILSDANALCDRIGVLNNGSLAYQGTIDDLKKRKRASGFQIDFADKKQCFQFHSCFHSGTIINERSVVVDEGNSKSMQQAMIILLDQDIIPLRIEQCEPTLESMFMEVIA